MVCSKHRLWEWSRISQRVLSLSLLLAAAGPAHAGAIFTEDFESGLSSWTVYSVDQTPYIETGVTGPDGTPTSVLNTADTNRSGGGIATSVTSFSYLDRALTLTVDIQRLNDQGVGGVLLTSDVTAKNLLQVSLDHGEYRWGFLQADGQTFLTGALGITNFFAWHNIGASVTPQGIDLLLDGQVVESLNGSLFGASGHTAKIRLGTRLARYDNVVFASGVPEPSMLWLMGLGLFGLARRRHSRRFRRPLQA
jgi:hypothetical protein